MFVHTSVCGFVYTYIICRFACMIVHVNTCVLACLLVWIVATGKLVPVSSLQLLTVVQPLMVLQVVNEVALVQPFGPQWPTPVTEGTPCKETTVEPAWLMDSGVEGHLFAIVSFDYRYYYNYGHSIGQWCCSVMTVGNRPRFYRNWANKQQVERQYSYTTWYLYKSIQLCSVCVVHVYCMWHIHIVS